VKILKLCHRYIHFIRNLMINSGNAGLFVWSEKEDVDTVPEDAITSKM